MTEGNTEQPNFCDNTPPKSSQICTTACAHKISDATTAHDTRPFSVWRKCDPAPLIPMTSSHKPPPSHLQILGLKRGGSMCGGRVCHDRQASDQVKLGANRHMNTRLNAEGIRWQPQKHSPKGLREQLFGSWYAVIFRCARDAMRGSNSLSWLLPRGLRPSPSMERQ